MEKPHLVLIRRTVSQVKANFTKIGNGQGVNNNWYLAYLAYSICYLLIKYINSGNIFV